MKLHFKAILFFSLLITNCNLLNAQVAFEIRENASNSVAISGSSTLHDWVMKTTAFRGIAQFEFNSGTELIGINTLDFALPVAKLKSGKRAMDKRAWKALKSDLFKEITYKLSSSKLMSQKEEFAQLETVGLLTIAGVSKEVKIDLYCRTSKDGSINCQGNYKLKMTEFDVNPPFYMDGLLSAGEAVTLDFTLHFEKL